jgi:hypothetical protein
LNNLDIYFQVIKYINIKKLIRKLGSIMENHQNINDEITSLKLMILQNNLKQNWTLDSEVWNEEFPYDY